MRALNVTNCTRAGRSSSEGDIIRFAPARRRSLVLIAGGLTVALAGALLFALLHVRLDKRVPVLAVARPVAVGQVVRDADLRVVQVSAERGLQLLGGDSRGRVVGRVAVVPLVPGSLLIPSHLGASLPVEPGKAVVGVALRPGQMPSVLRPGHRVLVVHTGASPSLRVLGESAGAPLAWTSTGEVLAISGDADPAGTKVVSILVEDKQAAPIADAAAGGHLSVVLLPHDRVHDDAAAEGQDGAPREDEHEAGGEEDEG